MNKIKKILALTMAVACVFALATTASAATVDLPDTANVYVAPEDNTLKPIAGSGRTAYLTGTTDGTFFPTTPGTNNATITTAGDMTIVEVSLTNDFARFVSLPDTVVVTKDGVTMKTDDVDVTLSATATNSAGIKYATQLTYIFYNGTYTEGAAYRIAGCTIYAEPSLVAALNGGHSHVLPVTMKTGAI